MQLVVDASILVAELLRERGRDFLEHPALDLSIAEHAWNETQHELPRRVNAMMRQGRISAGAAAVLLETAFGMLALRVKLAPASTYANMEAEARARIPRDPNDWPTVAAALALDAGAWTNDGDFLGCGLPTWTTETLIVYLARHPDG